MKKAGAVSFCLDTSALIAAWDERYPIDHFPRLWDHLRDAFRTGGAWVHESVVDELMKRSTELAKWVKNYPEAIIPFDPEIQRRSRSLLQKYPRLVMEHKAAFAADPFIIATAMVHDLTIVTEEGRGSLSKPKIPDVCLAEGQSCIRLLEMIRSSAWVI